MFSAVTVVFPGNPLNERLAYLFTSKGQQFMRDLCSGLPVVYRMKDRKVLLVGPAEGRQQVLTQIQRFLSKRSAAWTVLIDESIH